MGKAKYRHEVPETYYSSSDGIRYKGTGPGRKTAAEKLSYIKPQAQNIIDKFGGARELARVLVAMSDDPNHHFSPSTIYRWMHPQSVGGSGGEIPSRHIKLILRAARFAGILIAENEVYPHLFPPKIQD